MKQYKPDDNGDDGSYVGGPYDITSMISDGRDNSNDDDRDSSGFFTEGRPRSEALPVDIKRERDSGQFGGSGDPVPLERDPDSGQFGADPFAIGNFGQFNSPYSTDDGEKDEKYE